MKQSAKFIPNSYYKINLRESLIVSFSTFHVAFNKTKNVDKNNKRIYYKFFPKAANVYYIYGYSASNRQTGLLLAVGAH